MVQMTVHQVIDVVAVRHRFMPAAGAVDMAGRVAAAGVGRRAGIGIGGRHRQRMLFDGAGGRGVVQVAVVQEIDVPLVLDGRVAAASAVLMSVVGVGSHVSLLGKWEIRPPCGRSTENRLPLPLEEGRGEGLRHLANR